MKKMTALLIALLMTLMCVPAFAEAESAETKEYTHPTFGYTFTVPEGWQVVDATNVKDFVTACENGEIQYIGNIEDPATFSCNVEDSERVLLVDLGGNYISLSVVALDFEMDNAMFKSWSLPTMIDVLYMLYPDMELTAKGDSCVYGENEYIRLTYTFENNGAKITNDSLFTLRGNLRYELALTTSALLGQEAVDQFYTEAENLLNTFTVPAK